MKRNTFQILDIKIDSLTVDEAISRLEELMTENKPSIICTPNTEFLIKAQHDEEFKKILNTKSKLNLPDSYGLLWAARFMTLPVPKIPVFREITIILEWILSLILLPIISKQYHYPLKEKISGSDFIWDIAKFAAKDKYRVFLFGGAPVVAEQTALKLQTEVFDLRIAGMFHGDLSREDEAIDAMKKSRADILLVCLGAPLQEKWLDANLAKTGCKIGVGLGGTFDFIAKIVPRAPRFMQKSGLEWLYRLFVEPKRFKRQFALPEMALLVLKDKLMTK
jgi:N-acetylglucosaminyldiphosphoundecaprenol N-acetyl-beta-D-mannosaminyltransferase